MGLKKYTFADKRKIELKAATKQLLEIQGIEEENIITKIIPELFSEGFLVHKNIDKNVEHIYGDIEEDDIDSASILEWQLAEILFLYRLCTFTLNKFQNEINDLGYYEKIQLKTLKSLLSNVKWRLNNLFMEEYIIHWRSDDEKKEWIEYEPIETKTIIDNLQDIDVQTVDPIIKLLKPTQSENDIIANIGLSYKEVEKVNINNLNNLNEVDKSIAKNAWKLAKQLVNNVDGAKGHKGKSELRILDIAHNYALNVSLVHKLIKLNENEEK